MKILITAPSLDANENVSGISTLIRSLTAKSSNEFVHFRAGRADADRLGIGWIARQIVLPFRFLALIRKEEPDIVHINTSLVPLAIARDAVLAFVARIAGLPILLHIHGGEFIFKDFPNFILRVLARKLLRSATRIIVQSESEKLGIGKRFPDRDIRVLPNAIPLDEIPDATRGSTEKTIIYFGRLHESKGLEDIIESCRKLVQENVKFKFACYGTGPEKERFTDEMTDILGGNFHYGGIITGADKWQALSKADIFLLPSRYEGLPLALLEAMAAGCVPVVSNTGSISTVVEDGHNGFFIEPGNIEQIVGKLKVLLKDNLDKLRHNARETIAENFNMKNYIEEMENIYVELFPERTLELEEIKLIR